MFLTKDIDAPPSAKSTPAQDRPDTPHPDFEIEEDTGETPKIPRKVDTAGNELEVKKLAEICTAQIRVASISKNIVDVLGTCLVLCQFIEKEVCVESQVARRYLETMWEPLKILFDSRYEFSVLNLSASHFLGKPFYVVHDETQNELFERLESVKSKKLNTYDGNHLYFIWESQLVKAKVTLTGSQIEPYAS